MKKENEIKFHNKSDKPENIVERENRVSEECERAEKEFPSWMRGYFLYIKGNLLPMSRLSYLRDLKFFCNYLLNETDLAGGEKSLKKLRPEHFKAVTSVDVNIFFDYCRRYKVKDEKGVVTVFENGNAALSRKKSAVSVFFKYLYRDGFIEKNITDGFDSIKMPRPGDRVIKAMQDDEVMKMLDAAKTGAGLTEREKVYWKETKKRDKLILLLLVTYGLRISELRELNISSFNFERGEFKIYRKRGKESLMPVNRTAEEAFFEYVNLERPKDVAEDARDALFLSMQGKRLTERQIREIVKKYSSIGMGCSRKYGYSPHKLRATAATSLIERGNSIYDVQEFLDHDNVTTTQLYARHRLNTKRELVKNFEWGENIKKEKEEKPRGTAGEKESET